MMIRTNSWQRCWALVLGVGVHGCASTPGARPDDMSADEHRAAAEQHQAEAAAHESQYEPEAQAEAIQPEPDEYGQFSTEVYNPTEAHLRHAKQHRKHAADHEAAAEELEAFEEGECGRFTPEVRRTCPLMGKVAAVEDIQQGASQGGPAQSPPKRGLRIRFAPDVDTQAVIAHMRCHLAFARKTGRKGMSHCPLYVEGVAIATGDAPGKGGIHGVKGHSPAAGKENPPGAATEGTWRAGHLRIEPDAEAGAVDLLVDDDALLEELKKRARAHMPQGD